MGCVCFVILHVVAVAVLQLLNHVQLFATPQIEAFQAFMPSTISQSLLRFLCTELVMLSNYLILCCPLLPLPSIFPSIRVFSNESTLHIRQPKYWSFSFSISPCNKYSGFISFRSDRFDLLADQGTLKSLLQHHSLKVSILWHPTFFMVQLSHPYMTTGITTALTRWTFVGKVISLLFNTLSSFVIASLPKKKHLYVSQLQSPSAVILKPKEIKPVTASTFSPFICHEVIGLDV